MKMSIRMRCCLGVFAFAFGCSVSSTDSRFAWIADSSLSAIDGDRVIYQSENDQAALRQLLHYWLPRMGTLSGSSPKPIHSIHMTEGGSDGAGDARIVFVGENWIGDGRGVVVLADTERFKLGQILRRVKLENSDSEGFVERLPNQDEFRKVVSRMNRVKIFLDGKTYVYDASDAKRLSEVRELLLSDALKPRDSLLGLSLESVLSAFEGDAHLFDLRWQNDSNIRIFAKGANGCAGSYRVSSEWRERYLELLK